MIKKRLFALAMATVMMLSTSVVAFAEETTTNLSISTTLAADITAEGTLQKADIKVTVPTSSAFVINPYKLKDDTTGKSNQVISANYSITNAGEVDLDVDVTVSAKVGTGLTLATAPVASTATTKSLFLFINVKRTLENGTANAITTQKYTAAGAPLVTDSTTLATDGSTVLYAIDKAALVKDATDSSGNTYKISDEYAALIDDAPYAYTLKTSTGSYTNTSTKAKTSYVLQTYSFLEEGAYNKDANQFAASANGTLYKNIGTIVRADANDASTNGSITYSILGSTAVNPTTKWTGDETATLTLSFAFTPVVK